MLLESLVYFPAGLIESFMRISRCTLKIENERERAE
jgi:hypothetical protein